jgi:hypothetical protein
MSAYPLTSLEPDYDEEMEQFPPQSKQKEFVTLKQDECKKVVPECKKVVPECKKVVPECKPTCASNQTGYKWKWLGVLILWFILFTVLFWLIFYSLKPGFVMTNGTVDTAKVFLAAVVAALILIIIVWLIKVAITKRYN